MSRYRGPRLHIIRRLGELPGLTKKKVKNTLKKNNKIIKQNRSKFKESQFSIRLKEKQKLRYNYGITEKQLIKYVNEARRRKGPTGEILLELLEMRLDNILYRIGGAPTIPAARQLINHNHVLINKKQVNIPSYLCKINDIISFSKNNQILFKTNETISSFIRINDEQTEALILHNISRQSVQIKINELLVIEHYSRKL